jgi:hypothetical protein
MTSEIRAHIFVSPVSLLRKGGVFVIKKLLIRLNSKICNAHFCDMWFCFACRNMWIHKLVRKGVFADKVWNIRKCIYEQLLLQANGAKFLKILEPPQNYRCQKGETEQLPYRTSTHIWHNRTNCSRYSDLCTLVAKNLRHGAYLNNLKIRLRIISINSVIPLTLTSSVTTYLCQQKWILQATRIQNH